ncbi:MAG TPA: riboflavin biosynthesis protein RibF [Candidatus Krumholzibacteria bacterium]|nr:riboflavin biosynthesis protein RibF [Candidatus Krumholzibacteria bacterium]
MRYERTTVADLPRLQGRWAVTLGTFDGVHRGHAAVLQALSAASRRNGISGSCAVTFDPHPRAFLDRGPAPELLTTLDERARLLEASGIDALVVLDFDARLSGLPFEDFVRDVLQERLQMSHFVLGHDVHFGRGRGGNAHTVRAIAPRSGFGVEEVGSLSIDGAPVSSTRIRRALLEGDFGHAVDLMGHPYLFVGRVVRGRGLGRQLGFATANLDLAPDRLRPALGVYGGWTRWDGAAWTPAIANVGRGPTVADGEPPRVEVHVPGRAVDLYDRRLELALSVRIRPEVRFPGLEALRTAIHRDVESLPARLAAVGGWGRPERIDRLDPPEAAAG